MIAGRAPLIAACDAALEAALDGRGRVLLLAGEPGIGKTTLAAEAAARARAAGAVVRWGACWEGGEVPLSPWIDALRLPGGDPCAAAAEQLAGGAFDVSPDASATDRARSRLFGGVVDALREAANGAPQVVVLDDLQWADLMSLVLLRAVAASAASMRLLVVATYRDDEVAGDGALLSTGGNVERIGLPGLGQDDVAEILAGVLGREPSPDEVGSIHRRTAGNPLFVTQMARLLASGAPEGVPSGVRDVLARRLARLPVRCDDVLAAAAVLGQEFSPATVASMRGLDLTAVLEALDAAAAARLAFPIDGRPDRWTFAHALVQAVRYDALASADRAELHRRACDTLSRAGDVPAVALVHHALRGRWDADDPRPADLALSAADEAAQRLAVEDAAALYTTAIDRAPPSVAGTAIRARAWCGLGEARLRLGDETGAGDAFESSAAASRSIGDADLLARAALGFGSGLAGFEVRMLDARQVDLLEEAASTLPSGSPLRPWVLSRLSVALAFVGSDERRAALAAEALEAARDLGDDAGVAAALAARCDARAGPAFAAERLDAAAQIVSIGRRLGQRPIELLGRRFRVAAAAELCDMGVFDVEVRAFERAAARLGDPLYSWYGPLWRGMRAAADGRLDEAEACVADARRIGAQAGSANARVLAQLQGVYIALARGSPEDAVAGIWALGDDFPELLLANGQPAMAYFDHLAGRPGVDQRARDLVEHVDSMPVDAEWLATLAPLADLVDELGLDDLAPRVYELFAGCSGLGVVDGIAAGHRGPADRWLMTLAAICGDEDATLRHLEIALDVGGRLGALLLAEVQLAGARALRRLGSPAHSSRAVELDAAARASFAALGLEPSEPAPVDGPLADHVPTLVREGDTWAFTWMGTSVRLRHAKGIADLAVLLGREGREVHVRELEGVDDRPRGVHHPVLDAAAVRQYRERLHDLEDDLDEADRFGDVERAARLSAERDAVVEQLTGAFGLGGRPREVGSDPDDRLRKAVSARVKSSIDRVEELHPELGRHLRNAVRTGFWCSYRPERPVGWVVPGIASRDLAPRG